MPYAGSECPYCGTETDLAGDCAYYCEASFCGRCGQDVPCGTTHECPKRRHKEAAE
jgi:hypothetical protein